MKILKPLHIRYGNKMKYTTRAITELNFVIIWYCAKLTVSHGWILLALIYFIIVKFERKS
jgi:hypothetical protein